MLATLLSAITGCATPGAVPQNPHSGRDLPAFDARLQALAKLSPYLSLRAPGTVTYGDWSAPLWVVSYRSNTTPIYRVLVSGGMHGDEPAGPEAVLALIEQVATHPSRYGHLSIDFVPMLNPWGWVRGTHENGAGQDINRRFHLMDSQEAIIVRDYLGAQRYDLVIDHHEDSRYDGAYMVTYGNHRLRDIRVATKRIEKAGYGLRPFRRTVGWFNVPEKQMPKLHDRTFALYAREHHTDQAYMVESPSTRAMADRLDIHAIAARALIRSLPRDSATASKYSTNSKQ